MHILHFYCYIAAADNANANDYRQLRMYNILMQGQHPLATLAPLHSPQPRITCMPRTCLSPFKVWARCAVVGLLRVGGGRSEWKASACVQLHKNAHTI
jgi:hypothetical protein